MFDDDDPIRFIECPKCGSGRAEFLETEAADKLSEDISFICLACEFKWADI